MIQINAQSPMAAVKAERATCTHSAANGWGSGQNDFWRTGLGRRSAVSEELAVIRPGSSPATQASFFQTCSTRGVEGLFLISCSMSATTIFK